MKSGELTRHVQHCEKIVAETNASDHHAVLQIKSEIERITTELSNLAAFTRLNYSGFLKILKKHDKHTAYMLKPMFMLRLKSKPLYLENLDNLVYRLSKLYSRLRPEEQQSANGQRPSSSAQLVVRKTTKYWVHPDNVAEVKCTILKYLPVLVFPNEKRKVDPAVSSIYLDNEDMSLYTRRLQKVEGAEAIRIRWYGGCEPREVFFERKMHREDWTGETSYKARFRLKEKHVNGYLEGKYATADIVQKLNTDVSKTAEEIAYTGALAEEIYKSITANRLRPCLRTFYNRTAFQRPSDATVRISLDTDLVMIREAGCSISNWCRTDIPRSYPFSGVEESAVCRFPYAILEVKLQTCEEQAAPAWVESLAKSRLVEEVPKFSKFLHGCAALFSDSVKEIPYWFPQLNVDIRQIEEFRQQESEMSLSSGKSVASLSSQKPAAALSENESDAEEDEKSPLLPYVGVSEERTQPREKKIAVPVRVEPKVFFANERTFLSWIHFSIFLGGISTALIGLGDRSARASGYMFGVVSILFTVYALHLYQWRAKRIRMHDPGPYDDRFGPVVVVVVFLAAMVVSIAVSASASIK